MGPCRFCADRPPPTTMFALCNFLLFSIGIDAIHFSVAMNWPSSSARQVHRPCLETGAIVAATVSSYSSASSTRLLTTSDSMDSLDATAQVHRLRLETRAIVTSTVVSYSSASSTRMLATSASIDSLDAKAQVHRLSFEDSSDRRPPLRKR